MHCHLRCFSWHCSSTMVHSRVLSFQFISDLEIAHFWLLCHKLFCFGHSFWTKAYFSILLSQVINIFPVQWIDTNIDHLYGHIRACHSGHFVDIGHYGVTQYGHKYGPYWCLCLYAMPPAKSKMAARGPQNGRGVWKYNYFQVIGCSCQLLQNKFFDLGTPSIRKEDNGGNNYQPSSEGGTY